ncbi:MAG: GTPase ObgE [Sedimentisphaerales bacterium]|nr:GTPase ObgE [Sedimentisphaerales bacterium]
MFIDQAEIYVKAGDGGNGCVSFRREKFIPKGGPDGGDGGKGGSVIIRSTRSHTTLLDFAGKHHWTAQRGGDGKGKNMYGKNGDDLIIEVPAGTIIYDYDRNVILKDLDGPDQEVCVARGGRGGKGNKRFATPSNQTPRIAKPGKAGQERHLKLELKLIADIGLVGLPNAGKSTLLSRISAARPKVASYPFTTLQPHLGIVELSDYRRFIVADIPGLIEGSHKGQGLGHDFLRHIERTRIILHLLDISGSNGMEPVKSYHAIRHELSEYSPVLAQKPEIIVAAKMDLDPQKKEFQTLCQEMNKDIIPISSVTGSGLKDLSELLWKEIDKLNAEITKKDSPGLPVPPHLQDENETDINEL